MSYNTIAQFKLRSFPSGSFNSIDDDVIQFNLDAASSEINAALRTFHTLPMNTGSSDSDLAIIYDAEVVIASYKLMMHRGFKPSVAGSNDEVLYNRYVEIVGENGLLSRISSGKLKFPDSADATPSVNERRSKMFGSNGRNVRLYDADGYEVV